MLAMRERHFQKCIEARSASKRNKCFNMLPENVFFFLQFNPSRHTPRNELRFVNISVNTYLAAAIRAGNIAASNT